MKTKEEIEQLAQEWFLNDKSLAYGEEFGFIKGYTQCQEDLSNDSVDFADWIVKKGYKLNQMNYSNNGGMWFLNEKSIGATTCELYNQFKKENKQGNED